MGIPIEPKNESVNPLDQSSQPNRSDLTSHVSEGASSSPNLPRCEACGGVSVRQTTLCSRCKVGERIVIPEMLAPIEVDISPLIS